MLVAREPVRRLRYLHARLTHWTLRTLPAAAASLRRRVLFSAVSSVIVSRIAFVRSSISSVMLRSSATIGSPAGFPWFGMSSSDSSFSNSSITSSSVVRLTFPANRYPPPTPRTA